MDECPLLGNAHLSGGAVVRQHQCIVGCRAGLPPVAARQCVVPLCLSSGLLHPATRLRFPLASGSAGQYHVGLQHLFPHYHCRRPPLEGDGLGLPAAHDWRHRAGLQGTLSVGARRHGAVCRPRGACQPRADDLLLSVAAHPADGHCLCRRCPAPSAVCPCAEGCGCLLGRWPYWCAHQ